MACHHGSHHGHSHHQPCCCCCCSALSCCQLSPHPAVPSATTAAATDPLLQAVAAHLLQSQPAALRPAYHLYNQTYPKPQHRHERQHQQHQQQQKYHQQVRQPEPQPQAQSLIESLLGRIAALESALPHLASPPQAPTAAPVPPPRKTQPSPQVPPKTPRLSIRDLAARTIQVRFRQYLVRRSQALRHLKHLAAVRSHLAAIKSSLSDQARLNPKAVSQQATDLLLQLDSIQSTDPMIREGKRSISRELVQLLEFADGVSSKRHELFTEPMEIPHKGIDPLPFAEESSPSVEELAGVSTIYAEDDEESDAGSPEVRVPPSKTGKRVSFAEDAEAARVFAPAGMPFTLEEVMGRGAAGRVSANGVDAEWGGGGGGGSRHASDDERSPRSRQKAGNVGPVANGSPSGKKGSHSPGLSAPLPVQMEPRRGDLMKQVLRRAHNP